MGAIAETAEEQKRAVLAAGAEAGKAGVAAYDAARQAMEAQQASAVQRGHSIAQTVGVTAEQQGAMDAFVQAPMARALASLAGQKATFEGNRAAADARNAAYFDKIASLEPLVMARAAAASGGGGGGGGGSGSGDTGGSDLTDAQTGKLLMNMAVERRQQQLGQTQEQINQLTQAAEGAQAQRRQLRKKLRGKGGTGQLALRNPEKLQRRLDKQRLRLGRAQAAQLEGRKKAFDTEGERTFRGVTYPDAKSVIEARSKRVATLENVAEKARRLQELRAQSKDLRTQIGAADERFRALIPTEAGIPLSDTARQIATELGVDPALAASLVGPTTDAQYINALRSTAAKAQPNVYAEATALRVRPSQIQQLEKSELFTVLDDAANNAIASGITREQFEAQMRQFANDPGSVFKTKGDEERKKMRDRLAKTTTEERRLAYALMVRRYSEYLPTITETQRLAGYTADQAALNNG